jgi:hypothetical protein
VPVQGRGTATELLPAPNDHVAVPRVELDHARLAPRLRAGDQRGARAAERIQYDVPALT